MTVGTSWMRYRGDGTTPDGTAATTRGERGRYLADPKLVTAVNTAGRRKRSSDSSVPLMSSVSLPASPVSSTLIR